MIRMMKRGVAMIIFNGFDLISLAVMVVLLVICGVILVIERIAYNIKKRQQRRIDEVYKDEGKR